MKHYKDNDNNLYALDSESHAYILPAGCIEITSEEADNIRQIQAESLKTPEVIKEEIIIKTQNHLDIFAQTRSYDGTVSIGKYIGITDDEINSLPESLQDLTRKFRSECKYLSLMTAATWARCYEILGEVESGLRDMPSSFEDIVGELPTLEWPA